MGMFWLKRKKTVDDIIAESFSEPGRWKSSDENNYTDTKTMATLFVDSQSRIWINGVHQSFDVQQAFFKERLKPYEELKRDKRAALEKLYECK